MSPYEQYQDLWVRGRRISRGVRECAARYAIVRTFCRQYTRPFTVLDVGAGLGYFSTRLAEDFPECTVVAVEKRPEIGEALARNRNPRVIWLRKKVIFDDLAALGEVEHFDVVLALSVIHHIQDEPLATLMALQLLGDHLLLEVPVEDAACSQERVRAISVPPSATLLGHGISHLDAHASRPIYLLSDRRRTLGRRYLGDERPRPVALAIESDFDRKTVRHLERNEARPWHRGINLRTYLAWDGQYPDRETVAGLVEAAWDGTPHGDLAPWNVILQGDAAVLIDGQDPAVHGPSDEDGMAAMLAAVRG